MVAEGKSEGTPVSPWLLKKLAYLIISRVENSNLIGQLAPGLLVSTGQWLHKFRKYCQ
jgi:hypothetical protein